MNNGEEIQRSSKHESQIIRLETDNLVVDDGQRQSIASLQARTSLKSPQRNPQPIVTSFNEDVIEKCKICYQNNQKVLIHICKCENLYHSDCIKDQLQRMKQNQKDFKDTDLQCDICKVNYKIAQNQKLQFTIPSFRAIMRTFLKLLLSLMAFGGFIYWLETTISKTGDNSSDISLIILLVIIDLLYIAYLIMEMLQQCRDQEWEVLDINADGHNMLFLSVEDLNDADE